MKVRFLIPLHCIRNDNRLCLKVWGDGAATPPLHPTPTSKGRSSFRDPILTSTPNFMTAKKIMNEGEIPHSVALHSE